MYLALFAAVTGLALASADARLPLLFVFAKPAATLMLLLVLEPRAGQPADTMFATALMLAAIGDLALLWDRWFLLGIAAFLLAQLSYASAFLVGGAVGPPWTLVVGLAVFGVASGWLIDRLIPAAGPSLRLPLLAYAAAITLMVTVALAAVGGPWPRQAAVAAAGGAVLFYFSDVTMAWNRFKHPFRHGQTATLALYWVGQLVMTLALRWAR